MIRISQTILIVSHANPMSNQKASLGPKNPPQSENPIVHQHGPIVQQGLLRPTVRPFEGTDHAGGRGPEHRRHHEAHLRGTQGGKDLLRHSSSRPPVRRDVVRDTIHDVVSQTYKSSQKPSHVKFLRFLQRHVENLEKKNLKMNKPKSLAKAMAKEKALPPTKRDRGTICFGGRGLRDLGGHSSRRSSQSGSVAAAAGSHATNGDPPTPSCRTLEPGGQPIVSSSSLGADSLTDSSIVEANPMALLSQHCSLMPDPSMVIDPDHVIYEGKTYVIVGRITGLPKKCGNTWELKE